MDRRSFVKTAAATAVASAVPWGMGARAQGAPIRIGLLVPLTGVVAAGGKEMVEGFGMYWDSVGKKSGGRDIEIIVEDDASNPDTALQKARRLVEQRNVNLLAGNLLANTGLAVAEYVRTSGTPYFIPIIAADDLTQRKRIPNVIRVAGYSASQMPRPARRLGLEEEGLQEDHHHLAGLHLRPRAVRRLRAGVHQPRRQRAAAVLASAEHVRLQPVPRADPEPRTRRGVRHGDRRRRDAFHPAVGQLRPEGQDPAARRAELHRPVGDPHPRRRNAKASTPRRTSAKATRRR